MIVSNRHSGYSPPAMAQRFGSTTASGSAKGTFDRFERLRQELRDSAPNPGFFQKAGHLGIKVLRGIAKVILFPLKPVTWLLSKIPVVNKLVDLINRAVYPEKY